MNERHDQDATIEVPSASGWFSNFLHFLGIGCLLLGFSRVALNIVLVLCYLVAGESAREVVSPNKLALEVTLSVLSGLADIACGICFLVAKSRKMLYIGYVALAIPTIYAVFRVVMYIKS